MLYEVAIIEKPTKKAMEDGKSERIILPPTPICASSEQSAGLLAGKQASLEGANIDQLEVYVRPFCVSK